MHGSKDTNLIKISVKPNSQSETSFFKKFVQFFVPRLKKQEELGLAYEEAKVRKLQAEAEKITQEAATLAVEKDIAKQQEMTDFCANLDEIFDPTAPERINILKLAKLMETNPELATQIEKVNQLMERLEKEKGCFIAFETKDDE